MRGRVLVAGFATRHVAQSANRAGYEVCAVDHFCDQDLGWLPGTRKSSSPSKTFPIRLIGWPGLTYPLFICVALIPLAWLPYWLANVLWFCINGVCLWFSLFFAQKAFDAQTTKAEFLKLFALFSLLFLNIIQNNFANGQVNFPVLALSILFFKFLHQKKPHTGGLFLATAISLKLTPLLFLVYLLIRREWIAMAWTVFYTFIFVLGLPYLVGGPPVLEYYRGYITQYVVPNLSSHPAPDSIPGLLFVRLSRPVFPFFGWFDPEWIICGPGAGAVGFSSVEGGIR